MTKGEILMYDTIIYYGIATTEELNLVRNLVSGSWTEILNNVVYARTGYSSLDSYLEFEVEESEE